MNVCLIHLPDQVYQQASVPGRPEDAWRKLFRTESV